jgi:hypothetical protein
MRWTIATIVFALFACCTVCMKAEEIESGLTIGEHPQPLQVRDCTGPAAGKTLCYTCRYAERPTVAVFVRELSEPVARLVKRLDDEVATQREARLAAYVVYLADDDADIEAKLKQLAKDQNLRHVPLTILRDQQGKLESGYAISPQASVSVLMWRDGTVAARRGYRTAVLSAEEIETTISDTAKVLD